MKIRTKRTDKLRTRPSYNNQQGSWIYSHKDSEKPSQGLGWQTSRGTLGLSHYFPQHYEVVPYDLVYGKNVLFPIEFKIRPLNTVGFY